MRWRSARYNFVVVGNSKYVTFYIDDSACEFGSRKHVVLAAIHFENEDKVLNEWNERKRAFGLPPYEEVKWSSRNLSITQRREFVPLAGTGTGLVVIDDRTKQDAAMTICEQAWRYCQETGQAGFRLRFDQNIVSDWESLKNHVRGFYPPCVGLCEADSRYEHLIQAADFLAGAVKLKIDFGLGIRDPNKKIILPTNITEGCSVDQQEECEIGWFMFATLRHCIWGDISASEEGPYEPWKTTLGRGLVYTSSAPREEIDRAISDLDGFFMGCIH